MRKNITLLTILLTISLSCFCQSSQFNINGRINERYNGRDIMLFKLKGDSILSVDTTTIVNGSFFFHGEEELSDISIITCNNYPEGVYYADIILERGNTDVYMDSTYITKTTPLNILYYTYLKKNDQYNNTINHLWRKDKTQENVSGSELNTSIKESYKYTKTFLKKNTGNVIGRILFNKEIEKLNDIDFNEILSLLPKEYQSEPQVLDEISSRKENNTVKDKRSSLVGTKYHDFELITPENSHRKLSEYIGKTKYVFLDFWASWCSPCIVDIPYLKKVYDQYKDRGLQVISISLDTSFDSWKKVIKRVDAQWIHLSDLKGSSSDLTQTYGVNGIPMAFLIDQNGTIIEVNLKGENLGAVLDRLLK